MGAGPNGWRPACACETLVPRGLGPPSWLRAANRVRRLLGSVPGRDSLPQHGRVPACARRYPGRTLPVVNDLEPGLRPWCESAAASGGAGAVLFHRSRPCQAKVKEGLTTSARGSHLHRTVWAGGWPHPARSSSVVNDPVPGSRPWWESAAASGGGGAFLFHRSRSCQAKVREGLTTSARRSDLHRAVPAGGWHPARSSPVVNDPVPGSRPWRESAAASGGAGAVHFHRSRPCQAKVKEGLTTSARGSHLHRTVRAGGWPHPARSSSVVNYPVPGSRPWWEAAAASGGAGAVLFHHPPSCQATVKEGWTAGARGFRCHRPATLPGDRSMAARGAARLLRRRSGRPDRLAQLWGEPGDDTKPTHASVH
jgi:hypothetical protein